MPTTSIADVSEKLENLRDVIETDTWNSEEITLIKLVLKATSKRSSQYLRHELYVPFAEEFRTALEAQHTTKDFGMFMSLLIALFAQEKQPVTAKTPKQRVLHVLPTEQPKKKKGGDSDDDDPKVNPKIKSQVEDTPIDQIYEKYKEALRRLDSECVPSGKLEEADKLKAKITSLQEQLEKTKEELESQKEINKSLLKAIGDVTLPLASKKRRLRESCTNNDIGEIITALSQNNMDHLTTMAENVQKAATKLGSKAKSSTYMDEDPEQDEHPPTPTFTHEKQHQPSHRGSLFSFH